MKKIFTSKQVQKIDEYTILNEPISSIDLMERASKALFDYINELFHVEKESFIIFAGPGNNGGDGLAVARLLHESGANVSVCLAGNPEKLSKDCKINLERLLEINKNIVSYIDDLNEFPSNINDSIIIDALFGSGLTRPVEGLFGEIIDRINQTSNIVISIDTPSGLFGEDNTENKGSIIEANITLSLEFPFLSMMFAENYKYTGELVILPIGLHKKAIEETESNYFIIDKDEIKNIFKSRGRFDHKGNFGHALLIAGSYGKAGAAVLGTMACVKSGAGLVTTHIPSFLYDTLQTSVPEAMVSVDNSKTKFTGIDNFENFNAVGIGPGLGQDNITEVALIELIRNLPKGPVIDADALNLLSNTEEFYDLLPKNTIITPHPGEFKRLFGEFDNSYKVIEKMREVSVSKRIIIIYKAGITVISTPSGNLYFNTGGNPGMATGGSGDVLTGIILALLAQNYSPENASIIGVYLHSLAGDLAKEDIGEESLIASDIINYLPKAFISLR